jgi:hypothetical protein
MSGAAATKFDVRAEVQAAILAEAARIGPGGFKRAPIIEKFKGRVPTPTLYRWIDSALKSGVPGQHISEMVKAAATERAARTPDPAADLVAEASAALPAIVGLEDIVAPTGSGISVIDEINQCIVVARQVMEHARTPDGAVRMAKTLLLASEHLRRSLETAIKLQESIRATASMERFVAEVIRTIEEVHKQSPAVAELLSRRLRIISTGWS